jgi:hypothetical protein
MHAGLHALNWGLPRVAIALGLTAVAVLVVYVVLVTAIVVGQAASSFGQ